MIIPVVLSGGTGSRLWPVSRESHPKPFIKLPDGQSLLQKTFLRACNFADPENIITITNKDYYLKSNAEYGKVIPPDKQSLTNFLLEPFPRNTAPAIALAALKIAHTYGPDAIVLILPADHLINEITSFVASCEKAFSLASTGKIVTFGIKPTAPETGFGYIECANPIAAQEAQVVEKFVEKPSLQLAETYLCSGRYLWNAGMFCFKAGAILAELEQYAPLLLQSVRTCWQISLENNANATRIEFDYDSFEMMENISIDYALMEKSQAIMVVPCSFDWQDIGSWNAYKNMFPMDLQGNTVLGEAVMLDSTNNFIHSDKRMIASIGIDNLVVIDTPDALLISSRERTNDVSQIVKTLKLNLHESCLTHQMVIKPWGHYTILESTPAFKIKRLVVEPNATLSLQLHQHRSEHWIVVEGVANVINGDHDYILKKNESTFVPMKTPHRLSNAGKVDLVIIEIQVGSYLGEDDIVRLEDVYGRIS
jgi:mannose-1-phosphate guanylyltransferase/mannose-6-phosphate isomerase